MLKWMRCASCWCIRNNETASQVFQSRILMCSSRRGFGMRKHLISWTLPGSFIGEQTLLYLLVPLCFNNVHVDPPWGKEMKESDHKMCGTFSHRMGRQAWGEGGFEGGYWDTERVCLKREGVIERAEITWLIKKERQSSLLPVSNQSRSSFGCCAAGQILLLLHQEHESQEGSLLLSTQRQP